MYDLNYGDHRRPVCEVFETLEEADTRARALTSEFLAEISRPDGDTLAVYSYGKRIPQYPYKEQIPATNL